MTDNRGGPDVEFMDIERRALDTHLPGFADRLAGFELAELESDGNPGVETFRACGGAKLVVPERFGGSGATVLEATRVMRALAALAPSTAVAAMMHQFSVSTLVAAVESDPLEFAAFPDLLQAIAGKRMLLASGFAEGRRGQHILEPSLRAERVADGYLLNGVKKPCSLSGSMDLLTASIAVPGPDGSPGLGIALIPADADGLTVQPFWSSFALAGAESNEVRLDDVLLSPDQVVNPPLEKALPLQLLGMVHFQLAVCAVYTGVVSALVRRVLAESRGSVTDRADLIVQVESAVLATEAVARRLLDGEPPDRALATAQVARFAVQETLGQVVNRSVELLGGMAYVSTSDVAYLAAAAHGIAFHPPSRTSAAGAIVDCFPA
ncbi:acyl-CoA dehydrogenase family protein [Actinophytocola sediminis]